MHPPEHLPHNNDITSFEISLIIFMALICWPTVIIYMFLPWCFGQRRKLNTAVSAAVDKSDNIRYLFFTAWVIITVAGWFFSIYYFCF